jgi:hypothetical protein
MSWKGSKNKAGQWKEVKYKKKVVNNCGAWGREHPPEIRPGGVELFYGKNLRLCIERVISSPTNPERIRAITNPRARTHQNEAGFEEAPASSRDYPHHTD